MSHNQILQEIDSFIASTGMAETTFGRLSVNDGKFVGRLREGKRCWPETEQKVRDFIAHHPSSTGEEAA
jgi:hypothetical protein